MKFRNQLRTGLFLAFSFLLPTTDVLPQVNKRANASKCSIGSTFIECPKHFKKLADVDSNIRLLKYEDDELEMYFFITLTSGAFDDTKLKEAVGKLYAGDKASPFKWKTIDDPLVMDMKTKYKPKVTASMGLSREYLLVVKAFMFELKEKDVVFGYVVNEGESEKLNEIFFNKGTSMGDYGAGCNAVVSSLNSITKEFREKQQHCFLTGFSAK